MNRIIYIDIFTKKKKIRIIQIYVHADDKDQVDRTKLYNKVKELVHIAHQQKKEVMVMGDFNLNIEKYLNPDVKTNAKKYDLLDILTREGMLDTMEELYKERIPPTYVPKGGVPRKLDYIWTDIDIKNEIISVSTHQIDPDIFDHKAISFTMEKDAVFNVTPADKGEANIIEMRKKDRQSKQVGRTKFSYDEMDTDPNFKWENFTEQTKQLTEQQDHINILEDKLTNINKIWEICKQDIYKTAKEHVKNKQVTKKLSKYYIPKKIRCVSVINNIIRKLLYNKRIRTEIHEDDFLVDQRYWEDRKRKINSMIEEFKIKTDWDGTLIPSVKKIDLILILLKEIKREILKLQKKEMKKKEEKRIVDAIKRRYENFYVNQTEMIRSITNKGRTHITIEKIYKIIYEHDEQIVEELITDPVKVKEETNNHFQNMAKVTNHEVNIDNFFGNEYDDIWKNRYQPLDELVGSEFQAYIYKDLMKISFKEWEEAIKNSPKDKASGKSGISNEMIQHLSPEYKMILYKLVYLCIKQRNIPKEWKRSTIFPIAKPKPFNNELVNCRPITLLEVVRKMLTKVLNQKLTKILQQHHVLKGYQHARLPLSSTYEPVRILTEVITDANENNKELWILTQDMAKAYDRVNIYMLEKALKRIKIPNSFIRLIKSLYLDQTTEVVTAHGLTYPYKVKVGIIQGEVISPILWCIYYDPLLCEIQDRKLGYQLELEDIHDVNAPRENISIDIPTSAFMDDTQWISRNKDNLELILRIADSFYELNGIKVNKEKSDLIYLPQ
jgi:hypothetical protein